VKLLLDECVDRRLARDIHGHEVRTVVEIGWAGVQNGALLARAAGQFDAFVTVDRNLAFQQRVDSLPFAVVVPRAPTNRLVDLRTLVPLLLHALPTLQPGEVTWVEAQPSLQHGRPAGGRR
jgi:hypothetical protein